MVEEIKQILISGVCCLCLASKTQIELTSSMDGVYKYADIVKILFQYEFIEFRNFTYRLCSECATNLKSINDFRKRSISSYNTMVNLLNYQVLAVSEEELDQIKKDQMDGFNDICQLVCNDTDIITFPEQISVEPTVIDFIDITGNAPTFLPEEPLNPIDNIPERKSKSSKPVVASYPRDKKQEKRRKLFNPYVCVIDIATTHKNIIRNYLELSSPISKTKSKPKNLKNYEFFCKDCYEIFHNKRQLKYHQIKHDHMLQNEQIPKLINHPSFISNIQLQLPNEGDKIDCSECDKKFKSLVNLKKHIRLVHYPDYKCEICSMTFSTSGKLDRHYNKMHTVPAKRRK